MKYITTIMMLSIGSVSFGTSWQLRDFDLPDPASLWEVYRYTQEDADQHEGILDELVGNVWWMKYNPAYELNEDNSVELAVDLWAKHGWFTLVWVDDESGEHFPIVNSSGAEGEGNYRLTVRVDKSHQLAPMLADGRGRLTSVQMLNRELPRPEYGSWYAGQYYVDIQEALLDGNPIEPGVPPESIDPAPPPRLEEGFASGASVSVDPVSGYVHFSFGLDDEDITLPEGGAGFRVLGTTNLVSGEWFHVGDGLDVSIAPDEPQLFLRLVYEAAE